MTSNDLQTIKLWQTWWSQHCKT